MSYVYTYIQISPSTTYVIATYIYAYIVLQYNKGEEAAAAAAMEKLLKKRMRSTHSRQGIPQDCVLNTAEARREIVHALQLHKSSSSKPTSSKSSSITESKTSMLTKTSCNSGNNNSTCLGSSQYYCYSLIEAMPFPEPIWSTTATSVPVAAPAVEALHLNNWGESQASSYTWWSRFLKSMDKDDESRYPCAENTSVLPDSWVVSHKDCSKLGESTDYQGSFADDWLIFPTIEDHETQITNP